MLAVGIDPGAKGALCAMKDGKILSLIDMPDTIEAIQDWRARYFDFQPFMEKVGGLPRQSAARAFNFGYHCGQLMVVFSGYDELRFVTPQRWKGDLRVPADKKLSIARATELMPDEAWRWPLVKHDGRAEAAMIALWGTIHG